MKFLSPAKINLFFRVLRKRSDGYHEIASLLQAINLYDILFFEEADFDSLTCSDAQLSCDSSNHIVRALYLFRSRYSCPEKVKIHLEKKIPMQAGLGGGSSNAATTLWALNELASRPAGLSDLIEMGALLGSDVPFFFSSGTAYCTGRGEIIDPYQLCSPLEGWLIKPFFGLSTPLVYREVCMRELPIRDPLQSLSDYPCFYNDLEFAAFHLEPRLKQFRMQIEERGFSSVTMTGSGTTFVCLGGQLNSIQDLNPIPFCSIQRTKEVWYSRLNFIN